MALTAIAFYAFAAILLASAVMVISAKNPVHSVLYLILAFFNAAGLFVLIGAEFIAFILIIVYVGAVAVLFLFVVMMLDIDFRELRAGFLQNLPIGILVGVILAAELVFVTAAWYVAPDAIQAQVPAPIDVTNTHAIGQVMYTRYVYAFQGSGLVLLVAMIGAIVLTLRQRPGVRRQKIADQVARTREETMVIRKVPTRGGV